MGLFSGLAKGATSKGVGKIFSQSADTAARQGASRRAFQDIAGGIKNRMDFAISENAQAPGMSMASDFLGAVHSSDASAGAFYGGAAGAVGGLMSSDEDVGMFSGAAMGALGGMRAMTRGLRGGTMAGATLGGIGGMFSDDTSIMGGAFMGGAIGASLTSKYAKGFGTIRRMGKRNQAAGSQQSYLGGEKRDARGRWRSKGGRFTKAPDPYVRTKRAGPRGGGGIRKAGRATYNAMKRDVGQAWRGKRTRASKNTSTMGSNSGGFAMDRIDAEALGAGALALTAMAQAD